MKNGLTWIVPIVDESGSMGEIKSDTIGAYNSFISEQKKVEGEALVNLVKFNTKIEKVYESSIQNAQLLDDNTYRPKDWTRLYDAIGHTIKDVKDKIKSLKDEDKPEKVLVVIITDGKENRSRDFNRDQIFEKIKKLEKKYNAVFLYLGANQDAFEEGNKIGINKFNTVTWEADSSGVNTAFASVNTYAKKYRTTSAIDFSADLNQIYKEEEQKNS